MKKLSLFAICSLLLLVSCQKEKLPKATEKGKDTFGCKIDGKVFVPKDALTYPVLPGLTATYNENGKTLEIYSTEPNNGSKRSISIIIQEIQKGNNVLNETNKAQVFLFMDNQPDQYYETNAATGGTLTITRLDTVANIISGTFSFQAALRPDNIKTLNVTNGRFDITYEQ